MEHSDAIRHVNVGSMEDRTLNSHSRGLGSILRGGGFFDQFLCNFTFDPNFKGQFRALVEVGR